MDSLVIELQRAALDEKSSVSSLLRKALLVAAKLQVSDFESWARSELEGYQDTSVALPEYRKVRGAPKVWNPYHGFQDLQCETPKLAEVISSMALGVPVDALEEERGKEGGTSWIFTYPPDLEHSLMNGMRGGPRLKPSLHVSESTIRSLIGRVRTIVLQWSLTLEKQGVLGEGMTFTQDERALAQSAAVHIDTYINGVTASQIQVNSPGAKQQQGVSADQLAELTKLVELITGALRGADDSEAVRELRAEIVTLKAQAESPKPKRSVIRESLSSVRAILEGAAGEVLAHHLPDLASIMPQATAMAQQLLQYIT
jgi:hypothetical protein